MKNLLYSTKEFADLCGVKKQTLYHYDDIGLLKPKLVEENSYRKYSFEQYQDFLLISCLKEAGMSLQEIKDYLFLEDEEEKSQLVSRKLEALDDKINHLIHVRKILSSSFGASGLRFGDFDSKREIIRLEERPEIKMWATKALDEMNDQELVEGVAKLVKEVELYAVTLKSEDVMNDILDIQKQLLILKTPKINEVKAKELGLVEFVRPAGIYGVTAQMSGETPADTYGRLKKSMEEFYEIPGEYFYEEYSPVSNDVVAPLTIAVQLIQTKEIEFI